MSLRLVFADAQTAEFFAGERLLARYSAAPGVPANESPKPCLHPVQTLAGEVVTAFRPTDHMWHHGIAWAFTYIAGDTFWGGPTFLNAELGYQWRENQGQQRHVGWESSAGAAGLDRVGFREQVQWVSSSGEILLNETRRISAVLVSPTTWRLEFESEFINATTRTLALESPVTRGRPSGGYFGLMWRGPASWAHGTLHSATDQPEVMGQSAPWLAYRQENASAPSANLLFIDHPANPRFPTRWFARSEAEPIASFALAYAEPLMLSASARLSLKYGIAVSDDAFSRAHANQLARSYWLASRAGA